MSDTPRTNRVEDVIYYVGEVSLHFVKADFARTLERELAAVTAERDHMRPVVQTAIDCACIEYPEELTAAINAFVTDTYEATK